MRFAIRFISRTRGRRPVRSTESIGVIILDSFQERFRALTTFWQPEDYERHWRDAVQRIVSSGRDSCLITSLHDPAESTMLVWWPMYRRGDTVYVQNAMLFFDQLSRPFDPSEPYASVPERVVVSEDGEAISEWQVCVSDLEGFLAGGR